MKKSLMSLMLVATLATMPGCKMVTWCKSWFGGGVPEKYKNVEEISAEQLKKEMFDDDDLIVINVLSEESYNDCRISGSLNVPLKELSKDSKRWDKDQALIVYCASYKCNASREAYLKLKELGFTNVRAYEGGVKEWREKGFRTTGPCAAAYLK